MNHAQDIIDQARLDDELYAGPDPLPAPVLALQSFLNDGWRARAACRGLAPRAEGGCEDRHPWFPEWGETQSTAKRVCWACPVRVDCLEFAMGTKERFGIWGGLSRKERAYCEALMRNGVPLVMAMIQAQSYRSIKREYGIEPLDELDFEFDAKEFGGDAD